MDKKVFISLAGFKGFFIFMTSDWGRDFAKVQKDQKISGAGSASKEQYFGT